VGGGLVHGTLAERGMPVWMHVWMDVGSCIYFFFLVDGVSVWSGGGEGGEACWVCAPTQAM
jgi:hypothetical protein